MADLSFDDSPFDDSPFEDNFDSTPAATPVATLPPAMAYQNFPAPVATPLPFQPPIQQQAAAPAFGSFLPLKMCTGVTCSSYVFFAVPPTQPAPVAQNPPAATPKSPPPAAGTFSPLVMFS